MIFYYRDGGSGNGDQIFNVYDLPTKTWSRLLDTPFTDGEGKRNAYFNGPLLGPAGWFHLAWVWRETPDAATNHDLSYARSKDMRHWETVRGEPMPLPLRLDARLVVDPVPVRGGIINGNTRIGFDDRKRVTISYHKYDASGILQPWTARLEGNEWALYQTTQWKDRVEFGGGGTLGFAVRIGPVKADAAGRLSQSWRHPAMGSGVWLLDPETLAAKEIQAPNHLPDADDRPEGTFPGLAVKVMEDDGKSEQAGTRYLLRWETLPANRDRPRKAPLPEPSMLRVLKITTP